MRKLVSGLLTNSAVRLSSPSCLRQAIDALRTALKQIGAALDSRQFEKASAIGYGRVAEEFVFLQRTLGGLQGACLHKEKLVSDLAFPTDSS